MSNSLYSEYADWWTLLSDPAEYVEEAGVYKDAFLAHCTAPPRSILELGSGGGNNASHLKKHFQLTLVDLSPHMLRVSQELNPECTHLQGDMCSVRLGKEFDAVFIHDAIGYMSSREHLRLAMQTAYVHCREGGMALFVPDCTQENFQPSSSHGGSDRGEKGLRYLEWSIDHDPQDERYSSYMVYLMRDGDRVWQSAIDEHTQGLFPEAAWLGLIEEVGFISGKLPFDLSEFEKGAHWMYYGIKPSGR